MLVSDVEVTSGGDWSEARVRLQASKPVFLVPASQVVQLSSDSAVIRDLCGMFLQRGALRAL